MTKLRHRVMLWPTLQFNIELCPWFWRAIPWGYWKTKGGVSLCLSWFCFEFYFGCIKQSSALKKIGAE